MLPAPERYLDVGAARFKPSILGSSSALTRTDFVMAFCGCVFGQVQTEGSGGSSG